MMPTLTVPNWVTLFMAAAEVIILLKICWAIPKQEGRWLRGLPLFVLLGGMLCGFLLLIDYSEWKEGHATKGNARRAAAILEFSDFLDDQGIGLEHKDCEAVVAEVERQYLNLSESLVEYAGIPLPSFPAQAGDCSGGLPLLFERCRLEAMRIELRPEFEPNSKVGQYFRDRLFDGV